MNLVLYVSLFSKNYGPLRELNPGPPAPEAGIMPLDQVATVIGLVIQVPYVHSIYSRLGEIRLSSIGRVCNQFKINV